MSEIESFQRDTERYAAVESLCQKTSSAWPDSLGRESWYIVMTATLIACSQTDSIYPIFKYLVRSQESPTQEARRDVIDSLSARFKDLLMKEWTLIGIPLVISTVPHLARAYSDAHNHNGSLPSKTRQDQESSSNFLPKQLDGDLEEQGYSFMRTIYRHNLPAIMSTWGSHQLDFEWLEKRIIYGLFLSDHSTLNEIEAELVTLSSIMVSGLRPPTLWHVRGLMRMGVSKEDTERVCDVVKQVAKWAGKDGTERWIKAEEVDVELDDPTKK